MLKSSFFVEFQQRKLLITIRNLSFINNMPPKKQKPNGFMIFMMDMKPRLESDGHSFPRGYLDVHPVCSPLWKVCYDFLVEKYTVLYCINHYLIIEFDQ